jgi:hypothetical protein
MSISIKTHKMLWGRSGNICAFPDCKKELVMDETETDDSSIIGEEAHIVAQKEDGSRGVSDLTPEQRDKYDNLILLCSIHHKLIDDQPNCYTVEKIKEYKKTHEDWIKSSLKIDTQKQRDDEIYSTYLDKIIELSNVENWKAWTSYIYGCGHARMYKDQYNNMRTLVEFILSRVWPNRYPKLEASIQNLKNVTNDFLKVFDEHSEEIGDDGIWTKKFYKIDEWDEERYDRLHKKFTFHISLVLDLTCELTRAMNYLFDNVRLFLLLSYRLEEGVLLIEDGPSMDMTWYTVRLEYRGEERIDLPYPGLKGFMEIRKNRDIHYGEGFSGDYFPAKFE